MKKYLKKNEYYLLSLFFGIVIVIGIFMLNGVSPFGKKSLLTIDFFHQYASMLGEFYDRVFSYESLIYSFNTGLGIPFFRNFFNYLSSPLNIIIFLFKRENLLTSFSVIIGLRSILSICSITYYFRKKFNTKNFCFIGLGLLYAYCGYFVAYYWNIMWLDGMIFLPLVTLGIENIVNNKNGWLYTISLTLMIYSNYFIGYMLCIFSCIYFVSYLIIKTNKIVKTDLFKKCMLFFVCSLIAGALNAWALIPMYDALKTTDATTGTIPVTQYYSFEIIDFLKNHLTGVNSTVFSSDSYNLPNISCGILSVMLFIIFLITKKIPLKIKIVYSSILFILLLSFYIGPLDYIWHGFHVPNDLPFRYSFIYSFVLIITNSYVFRKIKDISLKEVLISYIFCILFITFIYLTDFQNISNNMIILNYILITVYVVVYILYHCFSNLKKIFCCLFLIVISIECVLSVNNNWDILQYVEDFYYDYGSIQNVVDVINYRDDELFYRMEKNNNLTLNDGAWYDYYGMSVFSSMAYNNLSELTNELGIPGNFINSYYYKNNTPIYDLMFNIKYKIGLNNDKYRYELFNDRSIFPVYKFKYTTGLMFGVDDEVKKLEYYGLNPFEYQNEFLKSAVNIDNVLYELVLENEEILYYDEYQSFSKITYSNNDENIYVYPGDSDVNYIIINDSIYYKEYVNLDEIIKDGNFVINNYYPYDEEFIINEMSYGESIDIYVNYNYYDGIKVYAIDNDKFIDAYNLLKEYEINITKFEENIIEGEIYLNEPKSIYTSIPYDKGWKVYNNDKEVDTYQIMDSLLGFDLNDGNNKIVLKYTPPYLYLGMFISIITVVLVLVYFIIKSRKIAN